MIKLKESMKLAGRHLLEMLSPTYRYLPYFDLLVAPDGAAHMNKKWKAPSANVARWWDTMLRLERTIGFEIPGHIEAAMLDNLCWFLDNPDHLVLAPLNHESIKAALDLHSCREGLMAMHMLGVRRNNHWAAQQGHLMLETLWRAFNDNGTWDLDQLEYVKHVQRPASLGHPSTTNGRTLEGLMWFYEGTGDSLAMELADRVARCHLNCTVRDDGSYDPENPPTHTHSYLGTLRGLLLFGELTNQDKYIEAVHQAYHNTALKEVIKPSGWTNHDFGRETKPETTSCGDVVQLALWLSRHGHSELLDDAERWVRSRLLPCQVTKDEGLHPAEDSDEDNFRNISQRFIGALGGVHSLPHGGKRGTTDITLAVLHTLIDIYENIVVCNETDLTVQFHFDYEDEDIEINSQRADKAELTIRPRVDANLRVRVPSWAPPESVKFASGGKPIEPRMLGNFAFIAREKIVGQIVMTYDLPDGRTEEEIDGTKYTFTWRGDEITGVNPNTEFLPFYCSVENPNVLLA